MKDLTFYRMTDEDRCTCKEPEGFTLEIEEGLAIVTHTGCGKKPWFMDGDWTDVVHMDAVPIRVKQITGCSGYPCYSGSCDCGPEVTLILEGK